MNAAAIAIVSIFAGILFVALIGGMAALIVLHLRSQKAHKELMAALVQFSDKLGTTFESARSSFTGIRQDIKNSQETQGKLLVEALALHDRKFTETMGKVNASAMEAASVRGLQAANKLVAVANTLQSLLVSHEVPEPSDLLPEEAAPADTIYNLQSESARMDMAAERTEVEGNAPQFSGGMAE